MLKLVLPKTLSDEEANGLAGKFLDDTSFDHLLQEDADVVDAESGQPLLRFRKRVLDAAHCRAAYHSLRDAARESVNRGIAAGEFLEDQIGMPLANRSRVRYRRLKADGTVSNTNEARRVLSGIVGYFDRNPRIPYCRQTAYNTEFPERFAASLPLVHQVNGLFRELMPERWETQRAMADKTSTDFVISGTVFTTITVNRNWQTAVHQDAGDLKEGFGVLTALRAGRFDGGYFTLPQWRVAVDMDNTDLLLVDVHQWHGNTPIVKKQPRAERVSLVFYYRQKMFQCGSATEELERVKQRQVIPQQL